MNWSTDIPSAPASATAISSGIRVSPASAREMVDDAYPVTRLSSASLPLPSFAARENVGCSGGSGRRPVPAQLAHTGARAGAGGAAERARAAVAWLILSGFIFISSSREYSAGYPQAKLSNSSNLRQACGIPSPVIADQSTIPIPRLTAGECCTTINILSDGPARIGREEIVRMPKPPQLPAAPITSPEEVLEHGERALARARSLTPAGLQRGAEERERHMRITERVCPFSGITDVDERELRLAKAHSRAGSVPGAFRMDDQTARAVQIIMESGLVDYATKSDFYRHAVVRWVHTLCHIAPDELQRAVGLLQSRAAIDQLLTEEMAAVHLEEDFGRAREVIAKIRTYPGGKRRVWHVLRGLAYRINQMPDAYWKQVYTERLITEWGGELEAGVPAKALVPSDRAKEGSGE